MSRVIHGRALRLILSVYVLISTAGAVAAATWTVHPDGSGDFPTIQAAVTAAADGDIIQLGDGTFTGPGNWDIALVNRVLTIRSISGEPSQCIIDCYEGPEAHRGFHVDGGTPRMEGLMISNGRAGAGGAVLVTAGDPRFTDCDFRDCEASETGGGAQVESGAAPVFTSCWFWANEAGTFGGGAYLAANSDASFVSCVIANNLAIDGGGGVAALSSNGSIAHTFVRENHTLAHGGGIYIAIGGGFAVETCRFWLNEADRGGAVACLGSTAPILNNCLFFRNSGSIEGGGFFTSATASPEIHDSTLIYNASPSGAAIFSDTLALPRIFNSLVAYNHGTAFGSDGSGTAVFECCDLFGNWEGNWTGAIAGQLGVDGNIELDPLIVAPGNFGDSFLTADSPCAAENNPGCGQIGHAPIHPDRIPGYEVFAGGYGMLPTLQAAIDLAPVGAEVVALGTFTGDGNRDLDFGGKDLVFRGGEEVGETVIDCEGTAGDPHRAFLFANGETTQSQVKNVTVRNGTGGANPNYSGGGIRIQNGSSPALQDLRIENCTSRTSGGGIAVRDTLSDPVIIGCVFENNDAETNGGGISVTLDGNPLIQNCEFIGNTAELNGGGLAAAGALQGPLRGCSFRNNAATDPAYGDGGGLALKSRAVVDSCDFSGNTAFRGGAIHLDCSDWQDQVDVEIRHLVIEGNSAHLGGAIFDESFGETLVAETDILYNDADVGGAVYSEDHVSWQLVNTVFEGNVAVSEGGAIYQAPSARFFQIEGCTFDSNELSGTGGQGAGLWLAGDAYLSECEIVGNSIAVAGRGGGLYAAPGATVGLEICTLQLNSATFGGALHAFQSTLTLDSCRILDNQATYAAAAYLDGDVGSAFDFCTVMDNTATSTGGAFICDNGSTPQLLNCSLVGNSTGTYGAHLVSWHASLPTVENSLLAFAPQGDAVGVGQDGGIPYFFCSDIFGNAGGDWVGAIAPQIDDDANFCADPLFCDLAAGDLTLFDTSPCVPENSSCNHLVGAWAQGCIDPNTGVLDGVPAAFALNQNTPNPFNPTTAITFALPRAASVELTVHDARGRCVRRLVRGESYAAGRHAVRWNGTDDTGRHVGSGVYLFRLQAGGERFTRKGVLIK